MLYKKLSLIGIALSSIVLINIYPDCNQAWNPYGQSITGQNNNDKAGYSVALSTDGTILAEGEYGWNNYAGRVRVFQYTGGSWSSLGEIDGQNNYDFAGWSVALSTDGTVLAVGERGWNNGNAKGRVRVFQYTGGSWSSLGEIDGQNNYDFAGWSVALSTDGTVLAEGERGWSGLKGRVRVFQYTGGSWSGLAEIDGQNNDDQAGSSVALSTDGTVLAVGEPYWNTGNAKGRVRVFQYTGGSWSSLGEIDGQNNNDFAGWSVALSTDGTVLAEGERGWSGLKGRVRVFQYTGGSWSGLAEIDGQHTGDFAGWSVALSTDGTILAEGERGWSGSNGRVRVFQYTGGSWSGLAEIDGQNNYDLAGWSVALSANAAVLAEGEPDWNNGNSNGRVRVFKNPCITGSTGSTGSSITYYASSNKEKTGAPLSISAPCNQVASNPNPALFRVDTNGFIEIIVH